MSTSTSPSNPTPLLARDPNTPSPTSPTTSLTSPSPTTTNPPSTIAANHQPPMEQNQEQEAPKSMEYHRQVLKSRIEDEKAQKQYISPSDTIMSPCTAKLSAYKSRQFGKVKPQSLFAKMGAAKVASGGDGEGNVEG